MKDPIGTYDQLQRSIKKYITTAFRTNSETFERERRDLLDTPGVLFQEPYVEPLPEYSPGKRLHELTALELPGMSTRAREAFARIAGAGLFADGYPLYSHQERMLTRSLEGKQCVVVTGTGSGKTESFLLPLIANIVREAVDTAPWHPVSGREAPWIESSPPDWETSRRSVRGERRPAAMRALVLYPMNALVEDQVSRLRKALDSDAVHDALNQELGGNRIRFGRYNGATPVSGHAFKHDGTANSTARARLRDAITGAMKKWRQATKRLAEARERLEKAKASGDERALADARRGVKDAEELTSFVPRLAVDAAELFHRWEMQGDPPDILVTNVSMLSIMLMRQADPAIRGDRADSDIFDQTKKWLASSEDHVFQLVIDELHLYRGTAGTEVAYLIRLLLDRLGLAPGDKKLRILASSASLDGGAQSTYEYLGGFFGFESADAKAAFHIETGNPRIVASSADATVCARLAGALLVVGEQLTTNSEAETAILENALALLRREPAVAGKLLAAFGPARPRATAIGALADAWFKSVIPSQEDRRVAARGLFATLALEGAKQLDLPRFRFHWMAKNVEGLWAVGGRSTEDANRRVGKLFPEPTLDPSHGRVLEVLYCECCGTQLLSGHKVQLGAADLNGMLSNPSGIPGVAMAGGTRGYELTSVNADLGALPEQFADARTDSQPYTRLGVVWLVPAGWDLTAYATIEWTQRSEAQDGSSIPAERADARWILAQIDPRTGIVLLGSGNAAPDSIPCLWFHCDVNAVESTLPAMPQCCPSCLIDYSERRGGRLAPIRSFVTGLGRMSHLLTKHLMVGLAEEGSPQLVAFSDSREGAASLAVGVEDEQWQHLLRVFLLRQMLRQASAGLPDAKRTLLTAIETQGAAAAGTVLPELESGLAEDERQSLREFATMAAAVVLMPGFANPRQIAEVQTARDASSGYVRLDEVLGTPLAKAGRPLTGIWREFIALGVNPAGSQIDQQALGGGRRDWTAVFERTGDGVAPQLRSDLTEQGKGDVETLSNRLRTSAWRAISGRLLYDLEAQGIGHLSLPPTATLNAPGGMTSADFRSACESVIRILTEERRTDPTQRDRVEMGWQTDMPRETARESNPAKVRVRRYLSAVAERHGGIAYSTLRDAVREALLQSGHRAIDNGWGVVSLGHLWVRVASREETPWICNRCGQHHWHASAGVCSRCANLLSEARNGRWTAQQVSEDHYNASEAHDNRSAFRLHAEELTGQTEDQAQRQRHFRKVFFDDDEVSLVGTRNALKNVDAIDLLSVTTTMEVGVDIGALQAVLQANMPPERFNYQQRSGRAGRQGQRYSAVLTYCRGQTHDRIHFDHPEEMTGGDPPPPSLALGTGQRMLADRLVAKEVLRRAFRHLGCTWKDSGTPPDSHGEMGTTGMWTPELRNRLVSWLLDSEREVKGVVAVVARATQQVHGSLLAEVHRLPDRIQRAVHNGEFVTEKLAHRLAEAGILPMYGMPTNVRSLYYTLRTDARDLGDTEARALDRDFDQAVSEFVPGAQRTWDKRLLKPMGLVGRVSKSPRGDWEVQDSPVGAAYIHLFCAACRRLREAAANPETLQPIVAPDWWDAGWENGLPSGTNCPDCQSDSARIYRAVAPRAFITDLDMGTPAGHRDRRGPSAPSAHVISPKLPGARKYTAFGACHLAVTAQGRVYRTNRNGGRLFPFDPLRSLPDRQANTSLKGEGRIWATPAGGGSRPAFEVAIISPKTTDLLAVRTYDERGLEFFDMKPEVAARRAAWYSAATILQRAIALELDVDSLDIEIASVHRLSDGYSGSGAELYLADAHPNGAGLVSWGHDHWDALVSGALTGTGSLHKLGRRIREELALKDTMSWRGPDLLLKGFRNRSIHGLISYALGMELLASLLDPTYLPGITNEVTGSDGQGHPMPRWLDEARELADRYMASFSRIAAKPIGNSALSGWIERDAEKCMSVVVHPLWAAYAGTCNGVAEAMRWATENGMHKLRLVDSFNLSRRMAWVRSNRALFCEVELTTPNTGESQQDAELSTNGNGAFSGDAAVPSPDADRVAIGETFLLDGRRYVRVHNIALADAGPGDLLVRRRNGDVIRVLLRRPPGLPQPKVKIPGGGAMAADDVTAATVLARALEAESSLNNSQ